MGHRTRILLIVALVPLTGCGDGLGDAGGSFEPSKTGVLTVVTEPFPTQGFWEGSPKEPTGGLEYEMAIELADRFGLDEVEVRTAGFSEIVAGDLGDADLGMALITPTEERDEFLDFSTPYIQAAPALVVREGTDVPDVETAQELVWALGEGTTFEDVVRELINPDSEPLLFAGQEAQIEAVRSGEADVAMFDLPAAEAIVQEDDGLAVAAKLSDTEPIAVALPEGSENTEAVSTELRAMIADGTLDDLAEEALGVSLTDSEGEVPILRTGEP